NTLQTETTTTSSSASSSPYHRTALNSVTRSHHNDTKAKMTQWMKNNNAKTVFVPSFDLGTSMDDDSPKHLPIERIMPEYITVSPSTAGEILDVVSFATNLLRIKNCVKILIPDAKAGTSTNLCERRLCWRTV